MSTLQERAIKRRKSTTFLKVSLHSVWHHSFHIHLDVKDAWELLARLSKESWIEKTGRIPASHVDKSVYRFITKN
jgi:hypothetical protein